LVVIENVHFERMVIQIFLHTIWLQAHPSTAGARMRAGLVGQGIRNRRAGDGGLVAWSGAGF